MRAVLESSGGSWRDEFTPDVTHLFVTCHTRDYNPPPGVKVITTAWFRDSVRLGRHWVPTESYESRPEVSVSDSMEKPWLFCTAAWELAQIDALPSQQSFAGLRALISSMISLLHRCQLVTAVTQALGVVVEIHSIEAEVSKIDTCDMCVVLHQEGPGYTKVRL